MSKFFLFIYAISLWTTDVVQSKYVYQSKAQRWIGQNKLVATWEQAKQSCDRAGAILASPINEQLLKYMKSYIDVNGHTNAYFIGTKLRSEPELQYVSIEGIQLDNMPEAVLDMIEQLDPRGGDCLSMNRDTIRVVPCWNRLPYICYTNVTTNGTVSEEPTELAEAEVTTLAREVIEEPGETVVEAASTTSAPDCNYGYECYPETGRCYGIKNFELSWAKAKTTCDDEGGYLVILNDETEAKIVTQILKKHVRKAWIGLLAESRFGQWHSIQGQTLDELYSKFFDKRLLSDHESSSCAMLLDDGTLSDGNCEYYYSYICEKDVNCY